MNVREIKQMMPSADVYELTPGGKYLIVVDSTACNPREAVALADSLPYGIAFLDVPDPRQTVQILVGEGLHDIDLAFAETTEGVN